MLKPGDKVRIDGELDHEVGGGMWLIKLGNGHKILVSAGEIETISEQPQELRSGPQHG